MNDTPQGDGNKHSTFKHIYHLLISIRMNDTPQGDGNLMYFNVSLSSFSIRMNDTPQGDGNVNNFMLSSF